MLKSHGHDVTVLSQSLGSDSSFDHAGIKVCKLKMPFGSYRHLPWFILAFNSVIFRKLLSLHKQCKFDLIDVPDHLAEGLFAVLYGKIPTVTRLHTPYSLLVHLKLNNYTKGLSYGLIKLFEKAALRCSTVLYSPSRNLVNLCREFLGVRGRVEIFGYPIDLNVFSPRFGAPFDPNHVRILFLGRLEQRKGIETIAEAFPVVCKNNPHVSLTLLGRDTPNINGYTSARAYLTDKFQQGMCLDNVTFIDHVPLDELPDYLRNHDIIWVPSIFDNYPLVCIEAMACGKAVIAADSGGVPELFAAGDTGVVFPAGRAEALAARTLELCSDPARISRIGEKARKFVEEKFSEEVIYRKTMELYRLALEHAR